MSLQIHPFLLFFLYSVASLKKSLLLRILLITTFLLSILFFLVLSSNFSLALFFILSFSFSSNVSIYYTFMSIYAQKISFKISPETDPLYPLIQLLLHQKPQIFRHLMTRILICIFLYFLLPIFFL